MSVDHTGNIQNEVLREEHDGTQNARRVSMVSSATIFASAAFSGNVTLNPSPNFIGLITVGNTPNFTPVGNVTLNASPNFIGLVTSYPVGLVTLAPSPNYIGLVSLAQPVSTTFSGNVTLDDGSLTGIIGNVTLNPSPNFIGLTTVWHGSNVTLNTSAAYIGLVTVANTVPVTFSGNVTLDDGSLTGIIGNVTLNPSPNFIGLVTAFPGSAYSMVSGYPMTGIVTIANPANVGNVTLNAGPNFIGLVTVWHGSNVTLNASAAYIGLATVIPTYISGYTSFSTVVSALATIVVPPSGQKIFVRNLYASSLGGSIISFWSVNGTATNSRVPPTSLATQSGIDPHWGADGIQWGAANDALTISANATVGIMADVRFAA